MRPRATQFLGPLTPQPLVRVARCLDVYVVFGAGRSERSSVAACCQPDSTSRSLPAACICGRYKPTDCDLSRPLAPKRLTLRRWAIPVRSTGVWVRSS